MRVARDRTPEVLSIAALDLFASALGMFILVAVILFPYFLKQPSTELALEGAQAARDQAQAALRDANRQVDESEQRRQAAADQVLQAEVELREAEASVIEAARQADEAIREKQVSQGERTAAEEQLAELPIDDLDVVFVMDTTNSMRDEIEEVRENLAGLVRVLYRLAPTLQIGFVAYRDVGERYLTRTFPLRPMEGDSFLAAQRFVRGLRHGGGGDTPERVDAGLEQALKMNWRQRAEGRIVVIGDAAAHPPRWRSTFAMAERFAGPVARGRAYRRVAAIYTGRNRSHRDFFSRLARAGEGDLVQHQGEMMESILLSLLDPAS